MLRKIAVLSLLVLLFLLLAGCVTTRPEPQPEPAPPQAQEGEFSGGVDQGRPTPMINQPPPLTLELRLSEEPSRYAPTPSIMPLVNAPRIYTTCVTGEVTFIRAADHSRVELPPKLSYYQAVRAAEDGAVIAYALLNSDYLMAFMDVEGVMLTDFVYESFGEDYIHFPNQYGYVVVQREGRLGLLNLASGQEVIAPEYDYLWPYKHAVVAGAADNYLLLDYAGQTLFEFMDMPTVESGIAADDPYYYRFYGPGYTYLPDSGELYRSEQPNGYATHLYQGMTIVSTDRGEISIFPDDYDEAIEIPWEARDIARYYVSGGAVLITYSHSFVDVISRRDGARVCIPLVNWEKNPILEYDGANVIFSYEDENDSTLIHSVTYGLQGYEEIGLEKERTSAYSFITGDHTRYRFEPEYSWQYEDGAGHIIIPFGVYGYIFEYREFLIGRSIDNSDPNFDILNKNGEVLLHNPWGAITYESGLPGAMVVWLDKNTCVLLSTDGSMTPILNPPQVERVYLGG